jgi:outer membrane protein
MNRVLGATLAPALALVLATPAAAQSDARVGLARGDVLLRLRGILVAPNERSSGIAPAFPSERVKVGDAVMPEVDLTWMASDHIGVELIASTTKHTAAGRTGTTGSIGDLASTWVLPPTATVQYHLNPRGHVRPYVGGGINYTVFWNETASKGLEAAVGRTRVHMSDSVGWAAQAGVDIDLNRRLFLNLDAKYIDMDTNVRLTTTAIGTQRTRLHLDPFVFGVGVGLRL